jgi:hypothetical protein
VQAKTVGKISSGRADGELGEMNSIENKLWRDVQIASDGHEDKKKVPHIWIDVLTQERSNGEGKMSDADSLTERLAGVLSSCIWWMNPTARPHGGR